MIENFVPCRGKHAVKEASLTVFVESKINDYKAYEELLDGPFKDKFQRFETVKHQDVTIQFNKSSENIKRAEAEEVGFKFIDYSEGTPIRVFQGINEKNRSYFTFHELNYVRWHQFSELFESCISAISKMKKYRVKAYSLHFIDEFNWNSSEEIPYDKIFKPDNPIVPRNFFESNNVDFLMTRNIKEKNKVQNTFFERIQITGVFTGKESGSKVVISHNLTDTIEGRESVDQLISSKDFKENVSAVHMINKNMLRKLLTDKIQKKINLNG